MNDILKQSSEWEKPDKTGNILKKTEWNLYEGLTRGEYFLRKIGLTEEQMKDKITEINKVEDIIIGMKKENLKGIISQEKRDAWRNDFQAFQNALRIGKDKVDKKMKNNDVLQLLENHSLELFHEPNSREQFSLVSLMSNFLFKKLMRIRDDLSEKLGEDTYTIMRKYKLTLGKIGPKALDFLLSDKISVESIIKKFRNLKDKVKETNSESDDFGKIKFWKLEWSMVRIWKEELDEKVIDKIKITEIPDENTKNALKGTYIYKTLFPHFCNQAPGSFQNSLAWTPEGLERTNDGNPTGFFIINKHKSQLLYFKIDQGKKSALNLETNQLWGINDFDNLLMRQISQAIQRKLWEKDLFNYSKLREEKIEAINKDFEWYCKIERIWWCIVITILHTDKINFEKTDKEQSDRLLKQKKKETEKINVLEEDFIEAKKIAKSIWLSG